MDRSLTWKPLRMPEGRQGLCPSAVVQGEKGRSWATCIVPLGVRAGAQKIWNMHRRPHLWTEKVSTKWGRLPGTCPGS